MPIYQYRCIKCLSEEEVISSISDLDKVRFHCGEVMERIWTVPQSPVMKPTGAGMALDSLNSKDTKHIKEHYKQLAIQGLEKPPKLFY